jgi:branched-subunit amino acid ABC-type transport system permease component
MVVVLGGVGQLAGTVYAALGLGVLNKFLEAGPARCWPRSRCWCSSSSSSRSAAGHLRLKGRSAE